MTAATVERRYNQRGTFPPVAILGAAALGVAKVLAGCLVAMNLSGYVVPVPSTPDPSLTVLGIADSTQDNSGGSAGDLAVDVLRGVFLFENSSSTDALTAADIGRRCYAADNQTVARTSSNGLRPVAGKIVDVDSEGVWVDLASDPEAPGVLDMYFAAASDLSAKQYYLVALGSGGTVDVVGTAGGDALGPVQNAPLSGALARVRVLGPSQCIASTTIARGARIASTNVGKSKTAVKGTTDASGASSTAALVSSYCLGIALTAGTADAPHQIHVHHSGAIPTTPA